MTVVSLGAVGITSNKQIITVVAIQYIGAIRTSRRTANCFHPSSDAVSLWLDTSITKPLMTKNMSTPISPKCQTSTEEPSLPCV